MKRIALLIAAALSTVAVQAQNSCATAGEVELENDYIVDAVNGTELPPEFCVGTQGLADAAEWYVFTPEEDLFLTVSSDIPPNPIDTRMHIFAGSCGDLECVGGDDDSGSNLSSIAALNVTAGETYYIVWDNQWSSGGFTFRLTEIEPVEDLVSFNMETVEDLEGFGSYTDCVVDMNGDYLDDIVSVNNTTIRVIAQQADGSFVSSDYTTTSADHMPSWSIAAGDIDSNGYNDLLYAGGSGVTFMIANDDGTAYEELSFNEYVFCQRSNFVDINADGHLDAFVCHDVDPNVFFMNDGLNNLSFNQGGLGDTPDGGNYGSVWIDYDGDCDIDLFLAKCRGAGSPAAVNQMHRNNGNGTFQEVGPEINMNSGIQTWSSAWADFDNDGDMDALIGASTFVSGGHELMENDGAGMFTNVTEGSGYDEFTGTSIEYQSGDFNNDGFVDVLGGGNTLMMNNGDMTFTPTTAPVGSGALGDLNNDGFLDIQRGGTIYYNLGNNNNWVKVNTIGTASNRNGISARVKVITTSGEQIRDIRSGEGFGYMSSMTAHFGLGDDTEIERIEVCWPSGIVDVVEGPMINETLNIVEGSSPLGIDEEVSPALNIFPNPATDVINITSDLDLNKAEVEVFNMEGQRVISTVLNNNVLDVKELSTGIYLMTIRKGENLIQERFTKH